MPRSRGNVEFEDLHIGTGEAAMRLHKALVKCSISLHRGQCIRELTEEQIDLTRRETIAGLRYGIEGMRIGGIRRVTIPPHLAYGETGVADAGIPPHAMLICDVELLALHT